MRRKFNAGKKALSIVLVMVLIIAAACGDSDDDTADDGVESAASTTTLAESTTTAPPTTEPTATPTEEPTQGPPETTTTTAPTPPPEEFVDQHALLVGLPWASPDDVHEDPLAAAAGFIGYLDATAEGQGWASWQEYQMGEYASGDQRSGEVPFTYTGEASPEEIIPEVTVLVRQSGPGETWWALGAVSNTLVIDEPVADDEIATPLPVAGTNSVVSDPVRMSIFASGESDPLIDTHVTGGGVFAQGNFVTVVGLEGCYVPVVGEEVVCEWPWPAGEPGTVLFSTSFGVSTVPVVLAAS